MFYILIAIYSLLFIGLSIKRQDLALYLTIFLLPTYLIRFQVWFIPMTLLEVMILSLFCVWVFRMYRQKRKIDFSIYKFWLLLILIASAVSIIISPDKVVALGIWKAYFIEPLMFYLVVVNTLQLKLLPRVGLALGASALMVSVPAIIQKFTGWWIANPFWAEEKTRRVVSWYGFPNAIGLYLAPIVVWSTGLLVYWFARNKKVNKKNKILVPIFYGLVILLSVLAIVYAKSEGALIGLLAGVVFFGIFYPNKKIRSYTLVAIIVFMLLASTISPIKEYVGDKLTLADRSGQIRIQQWKETASMLADDGLITGAGLSGYQEKVLPYHAEGIWIKDKRDPDWLSKVMFNEEFRVQAWQPTEIYMYPHNIILNFWSEVGLIGLLSFVGLIFKMFKNYFQINDLKNKKLYLLVLSVMVVILVHGLVDVPYFKNDLSVFWWLVFAVSYLIYKQEKEQLKNL